MKRLNKYGFTLVEVLGVIVIISILVLLISSGIMGYLKQGKDDYNDKLKSQLVLAGKTYYAEHKEELPSVANEQLYSYVTLPTMQSNNYIAKSFVDSEGRECSPSFIFVKQKDQNMNEYDFIPCLICQGKDGTKEYYNEKESQYCKPAGFDDSVTRCPIILDYDGTYDGKSHSIQIKEDTARGRVEYSENQNGPWSTTKPTLVEPGSKTIYVRVGAYNSSSKFKSCGESTISIHKKQLIVTATNQSKTFDNIPLNATNECTYDGLLSGHTGSCTCTGSQTASGSSAKTLTSVSIKNSSGADVSNNYTIIQNNGTLKVECIALSKYTIYTNNSTTAFGNTDYNWTIVDSDNDYVTLAYNYALGHGNFNDAVTNVTNSLKGLSLSLDDAISNGCVTVLGSNSNNTSNFTYPGPVWLKSGTVYFHDEVKTYTTSNKTYTQGYSGVQSSKGVDSITKTIPTSCSKINTLYAAGTQLNIDNSKATITYPNGSCSDGMTPDRYSERFTRYHPKKGGSSSTRLFIQEQAKTVGKDDWNLIDTEISNVYKYRWRICGGAYDGKYYYARGVSDTKFEVTKTAGKTSPDDSDFQSYSYQKDGDNNKYFYFAGWKPGGSDDCSTWKASDGGYCSERIPGDTSENRGGNDGKSAHHFYDFQINSTNHPNLCSTRSKKVLSSLDEAIYYRPTIKVIRRAQ